MMETRAAIPPGLPRQQPTISYWQTSPSPIADHRSSPNLPEFSDTVIIGSGVSGACIAYNLLVSKPGCQVVMLEARQAASGASGRNGGHTKHAGYRTFHENMRNVGDDDAVKIAHLEYDCMLAVHQFIKENSIQCDSTRQDTVDIFYSQNQLDNARESVSHMQRLLKGSPNADQYKFFSPSEAALQFLCPNSLGALQYHSGSLSAYKFTVAILELALEKGLNLQANTPATSITKEIDPNSKTTVWTVHTPRGVIQTKNLVLATNGYTAQLYSPLQGMIVPFRGIITAQRPGNNMPKQGLQTTYSFIYEKGYEYMITRPSGSTNEGDIVIGGGLTYGKGIDGANEFGNTDDTIVDEDIEAYLTNITQSKFFGPDNWGEDHPDGRVRHAWSGVMGYSADGYPLVGPVPGEDGLWIDASFQGHGMVLCFLCAKALCSMMLDTDQELDKWFPKCFRITSERMNKKFQGRIEVQRPDVVAQDQHTNGD